VGREQISCLSIAADGSVLAVGTRTGAVHVVRDCNSDSRQLVQLPARHTDGYKVRCGSLSPDASKLVTTADDARMVLWDLSTRSCMLSIHEHTKPIRGCCWSPDGKHICSVGDDSLLIVHDVVILTSSSSSSEGGSSSGSSSKKIRMATRLDGLAAGAAASAAAEAEAAGEAGQGRNSLLKHPGLTRMDVSMHKERLLACVPLPPTSGRSSCNGSYLLSPHKHAEAPAPAAAGIRHISDGVLCADQSGQLLLLPPDSTAAVPTGMAIGSSIACCSFNGGVVAAAKRDGAVTVMSCSPGSGGSGANATPLSGVSTITAAGMGSNAPPAGQMPGAPQLGATLSQAAVTAAAAAAAADKAEDIAVSAKMDMLVLGISACRGLGRVALAGVDRKNTQTGIAYLWEFDPSRRPAALKAQGTGRGLSGTAALSRQHSNRWAWGQRVLMLVLCLRYARPLVV
jgi:hypothetical protein